MRSFWHVLFVVAIGVVGIPAGAHAQATGTLINNADFPITYQTGVADASGRIAWDTHKLTPCERHTFTWPLSGPPGLVFRIPHWKDARREPDGSIRMNQYQLRMLPGGAVTTINVWMGTTLGISTTGNTHCDTAPASKPVSEPATPPSRVVEPELPPSAGEPPQFRLEPEFISWLLNSSAIDRMRRALIDMERTIARAERGEVILFQHANGTVSSASIQDVATMLAIEEAVGTMTEADMRGAFRMLQSKSKAALEMLRIQRDAMRKRLIR